MNTVREALGFNLRMIRGDRTQAEMAELIGLPLGSYQRLDAGDVFPRPDTLAQLAAKLGVSEASLVQLPDEPKPLSPADSRLALFGSLVSRLAALNETQLRALEPFIDNAIGISAAKGGSQNQKLGDLRRKS